MTLSQTYISRKQLLVDNLIAQGVTGYTVNDGLTTLINAVLEIQGGGGVRTLSLTSDKSILSYYDSESALLTATLLEDGSGCEGETVTFKADGVSIGSATTDSNGVATLSYNSQGVGDVSLSASVGTLSSVTFVVEDCTYYNSAEVTRSSTNGSTIYDNDMSVALSSNCEITFEIWSDNPSGGEHRFFLLPKSQYSSSTTQPQYGLYIDQLSEDTAKFGKRQSNSTVNVGSTFTCTNSEYHTIKYVKTGTSIQFYCDDDLKATESESWIDNYTDYCMSMIRWSSRGTSKIRNVKIKPIISV